jgi:hypothetical protein
VNHNINPKKVWVDLSYLTRGEQKGREEAYWFAVKIKQGFAITTHLLLKSGAHINGVPLEALSFSKDSKESPYKGYHQLWECFTSRGEVIEFSFLKNYQVYCLLPGKKIKGTFLFTVDFLLSDNPDTSLINDPEQGKLCHIVKTDDDYVFALPTNKVLFRDGYFIGKEPTALNAGYKTMTESWFAEDVDKLDMSISTSQIEE